VFRTLQHKRTHFEIIKESRSVILRGSKSIGPFRKERSSLKVWGKVFHHRLPFAINVSIYGAKDLGARGARNSKNIPEIFIYIVLVGCRFIRHVPCFICCASKIEFRLNHQNHYFNHLKIRFHFILLLCYVQVCGTNRTESTKTRNISMISKTILWKIEFLKQGCDHLDIHFRAFDLFRLVISRTEPDFRSVSDVCIEIFSQLVSQLIVNTRNACIHPRKNRHRNFSSLVRYARNHIGRIVRGMNIDLEDNSAVDVGG